MINKNNTSLNDLFRSASAETEPEVISQSEVERLLQPIKRSVPVTQSIQQQLYQRLLSTPLKIGMTATAAAACITLGIIATLPQTPQQTADKNPIQLHATYRSNETDVNTGHISQPSANNSSYAVRSAQMAEVLPFTITIPALPIAIPDSIHAIELGPPPLVQSEVVHSVTSNEKLPIHSSDSNILSLDSIEKKNETAYSDSWYSGYLTVGINRAISPFTAILPTLSFVNGIRLSSYETIGLRIGLEFDNPVIIPKYVSLILGVDSHTFFGDGTTRPFIWGQAAYTPTLGLRFGVGPGIQFRTSPGFSLLVGAGYGTLTGAASAVNLHFGIGF